MKCPYCAYQESKVVDSRHSDDGTSIRRRRECLSCNRRFTTYETVESLPQDLESAVQDIESIIQNSLEREVTTEYIGELVMERLKALDEVAYVRFASVYRQFKDIHSFMQELNKILEEK